MNHNGRRSMTLPSSRQHWASRPGPSCGPFCGCNDPDPEEDDAMPNDRPMRIGVLEVYDTGEFALPWGVRRAGDTYPIVAYSERALAIAFAHDHAKESGNE
jgi:hypothetical protein